MSMTKADRAHNCGLVKDPVLMANDKQIGAGVGFERTRRITGYLVGALDRFNDAKRSEEHDRVKHGLSN